ncbi:hypothetical protein [Neptunicoccus cionae]|uniref:Uncharacterized protein n=1 Tax=Neptunicoccus cionae TaxID=2035344 RepID=A0A916R3T2_9RHOB|nr:hypothetical protein [Amylibacter cionae]GGA32117.1 hypothetical protein GCM10011498_36640 [Amylibacter cionae]
MLTFIGNHPMRSGLIVALAVSVPHLLLPMDWSVAAAALTLAFIAGIYVGFTVIHGQEQAFVSEVSVAITFGVLALGGLVIAPWIIPFGLAGHAVWDMLHYRKSHFLTDVPKWYVPFCIIIDVILAAALAISWGLWR